MAKPFYSIEEVCEKLRTDADSVKMMVREGKLREFRDGGKVFFRAEDVDRLSGGSKSDTGEILLEAADDELPTLADSGSGGTSVIGLAPEDSKSKKEDSSLGRANLLADDEMELDADPMAKTQISSAASSDAVTLEGTGSGSGLLDLTREADDTSLGAELLDEIYPGEDEAAAPAPRRQAAPPPAAEEETEVEAVDGGQPLEPIVMVAAGDPVEGIAAGVAVGALIVFAVASTVVAGVLQNSFPAYAQFLTNNFLFFVLGVLVVTGLSALVGWLMNRGASAPRRG